MIVTEGYSFTGFIILIVPAAFRNFSVFHYDLLCRVPWSLSAPRLRTNKAF